MTILKSGLMLEDIEDDDDIGAAAVRIANEIDEACADHHMTACELALGIVIGVHAVRSEPPDLDALLAKIGKHARRIYLNRMMNRTNQ